MKFGMPILLSTPGVSRWNAAALPWLSLRCCYLYLRIFCRSCTWLCWGKPVRIRFGQAFMRYIQQACGTSRWWCCSCNWSCAPSAACALLVRHSASFFCSQPGRPRPLAGHGPATAAMAVRHAHQQESAGALFVSACCLRWLAGKPRHRTHAANRHRCRPPCHRCTPARQVKPATGRPPKAAEGVRRVLKNEGAWRTRWPGAAAAGPHTAAPTQAVRPRNRWSAPPRRRRSSPLSGCALPRRGLRNR